VEVIDVSVPVRPGMVTYPGDPAVELERTISIAGGAAYNVSRLSFGVHTGTHVDAPRHFYDEGPGTEALPLEMLFGRTRVVDITARRGITAEDLANLDFSEDIRVLFKTANSRLWGSAEFHADYVGVTEPAARYLVDHGVKLVGVDYLSVEVFKTPRAPAHRVLLGNGVVVIEGLNLRDVEPGIYEMFCLPLLAVGADAAPARVVLRRS
jgi:arylformamidase